MWWTEDDLQELLLSSSTASQAVTPTWSYITECEGCKDFGINKRFLNALRQKLIQNQICHESKVFLAALGHGSPRGFTAALALSTHAHLAVMPCGTALLQCTERYSRNIMGSS